MRNAGLEEAQSGSKIARRNTNNLQYAGDPTLMESKEELKSLLMKVKEESEKVGHSFSSKEQTSFNFIAAVTICSDFGPPKN